MPHSFPTRRSSDLSTGFLIGGGPVFAHAQGQHPVVVAHFILRVSAHLAQAVVDPRIGLHVAQVRIVRRKQVELARQRSEEHTSELQSLMRISYAVFCLQKKNK